MSKMKKYKRKTKDEQTEEHLRDLIETYGEDSMIGQIAIQFLESKKEDK